MQKRHILLFSKLHAFVAGLEIFHDKKELPLIGSLVVLNLYSFDIH